MAKKKPFENIHKGFLILAIIIGIGAFYLSIKLYPQWESSTEDKIQLILTIIIGIPSFIASIRKAFGNQTPVIIEVPPSEPPPLPPPTPTFTPLHQLPAPPGDFTGRGADLKELLDKIKEGGATITGVRGMGGIGKTALALVLADELKNEYPDAQIYLDLRGADEQEPIPITEALKHVVRAYHPTAQLPESEEELKALYNSVLHEQRALLLMDNARDAAQVSPLIPPKGNALVVTSRKKFTLPGMYHKDLETLPLGETVKLLQTIAPRIDDECAQAIAKRCGCLPHALRLAATALAETADLPPKDYLNYLESEQTRLELVKASLSLSAKLLDAETRERWYALGVFPESFDRQAAAAAWDVGGEEAQEPLSRLVRYSLVTWDEASGRYKLHDLARVYAWAKIKGKEKFDFEERFAAHYANILAFANHQYGQGGEGVLQGLAMLDMEWGNIQDGQRWAQDKMGMQKSALELCNQIPNNGFQILGLRQHPSDRIIWLENGLKAARKLKDKKFEGFHLGNLGNAHAALGDPKGAIQYYEQDLEIVREIGDQKGEGNTLNNLGLAHAALGDPKGAIQYYEQSLEIKREIGDRRGEGASLGNLGNAHADLDDTKQAIQYYEQVLEIMQEIGDQRGEGASLGNLGNAHADLGDTKTAIQFYEGQLVITHEIGDRRGEAITSWNLGDEYEKMGELEKAIPLMQVYVDYLREIGHPEAEERAARVEGLRETLTPGQET